MFYNSFAKQSGVAVLPILAMKAHEGVSFTQHLETFNLTSVMIYYRKASLSEQAH